MFYAYLLKSLRNGDIYVGSSNDVHSRLRKHNAGLVKSTKPNRPWRLLKFEIFLTRSEAVQRERFLKTGQQKERLKKMFEND